MMSEETIPQAEGQDDPEEQFAKEELGRLQKRFGAEPKTEPEAEPEPETKAAPEAAVPSETEKVAAKARAEEVNRRYQERRQRRESYAEQIERLRQQNQEYERLLGEVFQEEDSPPPPAKPKFQENPEAWYEKTFDERLERKLSPVLSFFAEEQERRHRAAEMEGQQQRFSQFVGELAAAENEYEATEEGTGYRERLDAYLKGRAQQEVSQGKSERDAAQMIFTEMAGMLQTAQAIGAHPAFYVDSMIRHHPLAVAQSNGARVAKKASSVQDLQKTAASPLSGSLSRGGQPEPSGEADVKRVVKSGTISVKELKKLVDGKPGNWRKNMREEMRRIEQLADKT